MKLQAAARQGALVDALPMPYPRLEAATLHIRPGQLSLTVAAPGVGKSMLWLNLVQRMLQPALYWSADTDAHDVITRVMALHSGMTTEEVQTRMHDHWADTLRKKLESGRHVDWVFDSTITSELLAQRMNAFAEIRGEYPKVVVVDNLSNTVTDEANDFAEQKQFIKDAQEIARESRAHIAILAHAKGIYDVGTKPIPLNGVINNLGKLPEIVLTAHRGSDDGRWLNLNLTKNRGGRADPAAAHPIQMPVDFARAAVNDYRPLEAA